MFMFFTASLQFLSEDIIVISGKRILKLLAIDVRRYHKRAGWDNLLAFLMKMFNKEEDY